MFSVAPDSHDSRFGPPPTGVRIIAPHFVAGLEADTCRVIRAAPILRYMIGWNGSEVARYCARKGWTWERLR